VGHSTVQCTYIGRNLLVYCRRFESVNPYKTDHDDNVADEEANAGQPELEINWLAKHF